MCDDGGTPFARGPSINEMAQRIDAEVLIIADADVITVPEQVDDAIAAALEAPGAVQPFDTYIPLGMRETQTVWGRGFVPPEYINEPVANWICVSGCLVLTRESFLAVGGFDERFRGWGYEDSVLDLMLHYDVGNRRRISGPAWHLAHPGDPNTPRKNWKMWMEIQQRYEPQNVQGIPRILWRTVPEKTSAVVEGYWDRWIELHPDWDHRTLREPINPEGWETAHLWPLCTDGAQKAGMIRLELLWREGGVYVDSDLEPYRAIDPLCQDLATAWACREDMQTIPDFILAAPPQHGAIRACLDAVLSMDHATMFHPRTGPWTSGPGVTTQVFGASYRPDITVLPPITFAPYHWSRKLEDAEKDWSANPETYGCHRWHASWKGAIGHVPEEQL